MRKRIPIRHSNNPKRTINVVKDIKGIVCSKRPCTKELAGDNPITFKIPNQKKTTNRPKRARGKDHRLEKFRNFASKLSSDISILYYKTILLSCFSAGALRFLDIREL